MGPDPFNMPGLGSNTGGNQPALNQAVGQLAPYATTYHGPVSGAPDIGQVFNTPKVTAPKGDFFSWAHHVANSVGGLAEHFGKAIWHLDQNVVTAVPRYAAGIWHAHEDNHLIGAINQASQAQSVKIQNLHNQYKAGLISAKEFKSGLLDLNYQNVQLNNDSMALQNKVALDKTNAYKAFIDTAGDLVMALTLGAGSPEVEAAANLLKSEAVDPLLTEASGNLAKVMGNKELFAQLSSSTQSGLLRSLGEIVSQMPVQMSAGQIGKTVTTNFMLKYPMQYWITTGAGDAIFTDLQNKNYGKAVKDLGYNAALFASGGIFGAAFKYGDRFMGGLGHAVFGQTAFWDEFSRLVGNGDPAQAKQAITELTSGMSYTEQRAFFKNLSAAEATNMHAMNGDAVAAASRMAEGLKSLHSAPDLTGLDMKGLLKESNDFFTHYRAVSTKLASLGHDNVALGRFTGVDRGNIATRLSTEASTVEDRLKLWESMKEENPNATWAINKSIDEQIKNIIQNKPKDLNAAINDIRAGYSVKGVGGIPEVKAAIKAGYVPITPHNLDAPFKEGSGKVMSAFADNNEFWTKTVEPLPVFGTMGQLLTTMGMSPYAAVQRTYQLFNTFTAENLMKTNVIKSIESQLNEAKAAKAAASAERAAGNTEASLRGQILSENPDLMKQAKQLDAMEAKSGTGSAKYAKLNDKFEAGMQKAMAGRSAPVKEFKRVENVNDWIMKALSSYAKNPTRGAVVSHMPIQDYRMLTNADIVKALEERGVTISKSQANEIRHAIADAHVKIPVAVAGLGERLTAYNFRFNPLAGRYSRLQGALRFAWNPFFQKLRLEPKTEFLSEVMGGGMFRSLFAGRWGEIGKIRGYLRDAGVFSEHAKLGEILPGEAVQQFGAEVPNLSKKLTVMQERSIAGLIDAQARRLGMHWQDYVDTMTQNVRDDVQTIAEYDKRSQLLNSPLVRTMNIAIFPFRFELKVATIMAKSLAQADLITRVAVLKGLTEAHDFLNSPQGQAWYAANSEMIGLFKYISPLASLNEVFQNLIPGHEHSLGNFGELGGLPFGFIPQLLDSAGVTNFQQPGVNAKTGAVYPEYIPQDAKAHVAIAIQDFLNTLFSYPGATVGLKSKTSLVGGVANAVTRANLKTDYSKITPGNDQLTPQQQDYSQLIQGLHNTAPGTNGPFTPGIIEPQPLRPGIRVPSTAPALPRKPSKSGSGSRSGTRAKKLKESQYTPYLLPGQSKLGQLP